jgi:hypothetical protein
MPAMKLRSAPFQNYLLPVFDGPNDPPPGDPPPPPPPPPPKRPELPPSKHDADLPKQETFDRPYVEELRSENKTWRGKMVAEREQRVAAEKERDDARAAAEAAKKAAETEATTKVTAAEQRANERVIRAELKVAAQKAGMIDLDVLKLVDLTSVKLTEAGEVEGADALMTKLKEDKPHFFGNPVKGSSNPNPPPNPGDKNPKMAKDMTQAERDAFLKEHKKKFG